jgi:hypothetical protein
MVVNVEQVQNGVINFVEKEIASKAVGIKKFGIYFMLPTIKSKVSTYLFSIKDFMPELFDENNNIEISEVYNFAKDAIKKSGQFEFMGIIFNETDIDKLYAYITPTTSMQ